MAQFIEVTGVFDYSNPVYEKVLVNVELVRHIIPIRDERKSKTEAKTRLCYEGFGVIEVCEEYETIKQMIVRGRFQPTGSDDHDGVHGGGIGKDE